MSLSLKKVKPISNVMLSNCKQPACFLGIKSIFTSYCSNGEWQLYIRFAMIQKILVAVFFFTQFSCTQPAIVKKLKGCDSLVIAFGKPGSGGFTREITTTETKAIQKLARFLHGAETEKYKCGFDGNMLFFKAGRPVMPVVFKYSESGCRAFEFDLDNKVISTKMSNEAADFLKSLSEGRSWY
jgi:hypothetical protein